MSIENLAKPGNNSGSLVKFALILITIFYIGINFAWLQADSSQLSWDTADHGYLALSYRDYIEKNGFLSFIANFGNVPSFNDIIDRVYPPLVHLIASLAHSLSGSRSIDVAVAAMNIVFIPILVYAVFQTGRLIFGERAGFLSVAVVLFYPLTISMSRHFLLELPLLSFVSLALYAYLRSSYFRLRSYSTCAGIIFGLGSMVKISFYLFIIPLLIHQSYILAIEWRTDKPAFKDRLSNVFIALFLALVISLPWYASHIKDYFARYNAVRLFPKDKDEFFFYPKIILRAFYLPNIIAFFCGLLMCFKSRIKPGMFLSFWLFSAVFLLEALLFTKKMFDPRYMVPVSSVVALVTVCGIYSIKRKIIRHIFIWFVVLYGCMVFYIFTLGPGRLHFKFTQKFFYPSWWQELYHPYPLKEQWKMDKVMDKLHEEDNKRNYKIKLLYNFNHRYYNYSTLRYYSCLNSVPMYIIPCRSVEDLLKSRSIDLYFLDKTGKRDLPKNQALEGERLSGFLVEDQGNSFRVITRRKLPDGSYIILYRYLFKKDK